MNKNSYFSSNASRYWRKFWLINGSQRKLDFPSFLFFLVYPVINLVMQKCTPRQDNLNVDYYYIFTDRTVYCFPFHWNLLFLYLKHIMYPHFYNALSDFCINIMHLHIYGVIFIIREHNLSLFLEYIFAYLKKKTRILISVNELH